MGCFYKFNLIFIFVDLVIMLDQSIRFMLILNSNLKNILLGLF